MDLLRGTALLLAAGLLGGCAHSPPDEPSDPLEPVNRAVFGLNRAADKYVLRPVAKGYEAITPQIAQQGITNFFENIKEPRNVVNGVLQLKFAQAANDTGRFLLNTTAGIAGLMDVATMAGLPKHDEDFGQTLGHYGLGQGWYLMLPLLGPTTGRDLSGRAADFATDLNNYVESPESIGVNALNLIDARVQFLDADSIIDNAIDPYIFVRTAYLQQRLGKVFDGSPPAKYMYGDTEADE